MATLLTLVVIPVVYSLVDRKSEAGVSETQEVGDSEEVTGAESVVIEPLREMS